MIKIIMLNSCFEFVVSEILNLARYLAVKVTSARIYVHGFKRLWSIGGSRN